MFQFCDSLGITVSRFLRRSLLPCPAYACPQMTHSIRIANMAFARFCRPTLSSAFCPRAPALSSSRIFVCGASYTVALFFRALLAFLVACIPAIRICVPLFPSRFSTVDQTVKLGCSLPSSPISLRTCEGFVIRGAERQPTERITKDWSVETMCERDFIPV